MPYVNADASASGIPARDRRRVEEGPGAMPTIGSATAIGGFSAALGARAEAIATPATASMTPAAPRRLRCSPSTMTASSVVIPP